MEQLILSRLFPLLLFAVLCLTFLLAYVRLSTEVTHRYPTRRGGHGRGPVPTSVPPRPFWPTCHRNASAANVSGFAELPETIQNLLYYRHCRHFPLLLDVPRKCYTPDGTADVFLLLVIKSPPGNHERRQALRTTWAWERQHNGAWIRLVFISGTVGSGFEKQRMNALMALEHRQYGDIIQWDFNDTFQNLTLKQVMFLEWLQRHCPHARFLLNGDDDVFAHTENIVAYLQSLPGNTGDKHLYVGHLLVDDTPIRDAKSKYYVPTQVQESDIFPTICLGGGFLLSGYSAKVMYDMSPAVALLPTDDVYLGMCMDRAGLKASAHVGVQLRGIKIPSAEVDAYDPCYFKDTLIVHRFMPLQNYLMWDQVHDPELRCWTGDAGDHGVNGGGDPDAVMSS